MAQVGGGDFVSAGSGPVVYRPTPEYNRAVATALLRVYTRCLICGHGAEPGEEYSLLAGCPYRHHQQALTALTEVL